MGELENGSLVYPGDLEWAVGVVEIVGVWLAIRFS